MFALSLLSPTVFAQEANESASNGSNLEEVIVTAQRREQNVMSVPLSIQAISGEQLTNNGIEDLTSLQFKTPGFLPDTNNGFVQIYMRGIGNAIFLGADPSVATFIDDVPQIYGVMLGNLVDVDRVEILKGAQGGLYGRNATGGVVNIITRQPSTEAMRGDFVVSYGEKDSFYAAGYLNLPLSDKIAWSISVQHDTHDAYVANGAPKVPYTAVNFPTGAFLPIPNGSAPVPAGPGLTVYQYTPQQTANFFNAPHNPPDVFDQDFWAGRTKLLFEPTENLSFTLAGNYGKKDDTNSGQFYSSTPAFNQAVLTGLFDTFGITTNLPPGFIQGKTGKWGSSIGVDNNTYIRDYSASGTLVWNGPEIDLTSITAYREMRTSTAADSGTSTVAFVPLFVNFDRDYIYQELRAVSNFQGPWRFLGGATYLKNNLAGKTDLFFLSYQIPLGSTQVDQTIHNWSIYGEVGYDITDRWNLTVSGRYMNEKNEADFTLPIESGTVSEQDKLVPSATLSYALDGGNAYLRWARGFKTGGVNILTAPAFYPQPSDGSIFGPETVDTYEVGIKQSLFDRRLQVTAAVFYNDYQDLQVDVRPRPQFPAITTAIINADSAETYGAEASVVWRVVDPLTIGLNVGYLHAEYKDFALSGSTVLSDFDLSGEQMPKAPEWQYSLNADLDQPISDNLNLVGNLLVSRTSDVIFKYAAFQGVLPNAVGESYWLVNARVGVRTDDDKYGFYLVADNVFDEEYHIGADAGSFGNLLGYGQRRIVRGEFSMKF